MFGLAVLGAIGLAFALFGAGGGLLHSDPSVFVAVLILLALLTAGSIPFALGRSQGDSRARGISRVFLGVLTLFGGMIAIGTVVVVAFLIFAFAVCLTGAKC
jgi:hypothetical protein